MPLSTGSLLTAPIARFTDSASIHPCARVARAFPMQNTTVPAATDQETLQHFVAEHLPEFFQYGEPAPSLSPFWSGVHADIQTIGKLLSNKTVC